MPVTFQLHSERPLDLVSFGWSPLFEAILSLKVVRQPKKEPMHLPWARRCRDLPADLQEEMHFLSPAYAGMIPGIFEVGFMGDSPHFQDELAAFRTLDERTVAWELSLGLGGLHCGWILDHDDRHVEDPDYRANVQAAAVEAGHGELTRAALEDPAATRDRYADLLERYWEEAFSAEWDRIRPMIDADVADGARALVTRGVPGLVDLLLPEGTWHPETNEIVVEKKTTAVCDVAERGGLLFVPTVYGWPKVWIELAPPWPVNIMFPARSLREPDVVQATDHEVADGLRALGDETRLQITRMVAEQPRSTKELAELLRLSDSAVSRHLRVLAGAGVVEGKRDGYFVLYRLKPDRIGQLGGALRRTLGLAHAPSGDMPHLPVTVARSDA
ncbi:MAG TPA: DUF5937 family protein [Nitriliruptorales bacterium]